MQKLELVAKVAQSANITKVCAAAAVEAVIAEISAALSKGESVSLVGFGAFTVQHRAARSGRNPSTGQAMVIAAATVPRFTAGKALKEAVAGKGLAVKKPASQAKKKSNA